MKNLIIAGAILIGASSCSSGWSDEQRTTIINGCQKSYINGLKKGGLEFDEKLIEDAVLEGCKCVQEKREKEYENGGSYKYDEKKEMPWMKECLDSEVILKDIL